VADVQALVKLASQHQTSLIPRAAGTSLAGQVVGNGIVVDLGHFFNKIIEVNPQENWVRVQPGVVRDELNRHLKEHNLFFGPETSTANRAMVGGMVGNNSCGSNSLRYGSAREHLLEVKMVLENGTEATFNALEPAQYQQKLAQKPASTEARIYQTLHQILSQPQNAQGITQAFPKPSIPRRNTGYALDMLLQQQPHNPQGPPANLCALIAGAEGTLGIITELKLHLDPLPPQEKLLVCIHCHSIDQALKANLVALQFSPYASELMDHYILECTKNNIEHRQNRFFVKGDPAAILVVELAANTQEAVQWEAGQLIEALQNQELGYHFPVVSGTDIKRVWALRKAGLGLLSNMPGDAKPAPVIEDTAVDVNDLPQYIADFNQILKKHNLYCVHYAHAGSGELHLRPILNLKTQQGQALFRTIATEIAHLVKKYKGSLSGEHGDGRLRGEFIPLMVGQHNYQLFQQVKQAFDPQNIFNPGKIVNTAPMDTHLRYTAGQQTPTPETWFDWSDFNGIVRAAENCNGSGDCRKSHEAGGTMCPSYQATRQEKDTTRARANILREMLTHSPKQNPFDHKEIKEVMDLCLSCKACKAECPSNVDMARLKAEWQQQYYQANGVPLRTRLIGNFSRLMALSSLAPWLFNPLMAGPLGPLARQVVGFAPKRSMPHVYRRTLRKWYKKNQRRLQIQPAKRKGRVLFFVDEFTNYNDVPIGAKALELLVSLGYEPQLIDHTESGRTYISKGLLKQARKCAIQNVNALALQSSEKVPVVGLEPSAILTLRDEYPLLVPKEMQPQAQTLARHTLLIDEFLSQEIQKGNISPQSFTQEPRLIKLHGHCYQKALSSLTHTKRMLSLPANFEMHVINSGCCGMAGAFGYEKEHYNISMQIAELVLLPTVRKQEPKTIIAATGTSCRHQIKDGAGRIAQHPVEILHSALIQKV